MEKTRYIPEESLAKVRALYPHLDFELQPDDADGTGAYVANILGRARMRDTREETEQAIADATNFRLLAALP